jgi:hypothetical protein
MVEEVEWNTVTGWPSQVLDGILEDMNEKYDAGFWSELGQLVRGELRLEYKAGMTVDPDRRASEYGDDWDYMEVVYETQSYDHASAVEDGIIQEYIDDKWNNNERAGGGGRLPEGDETHYVYIVYTI